jgi:hypothetical protein
MEVEAMTWTWLYMPLEAAVFLAFSAALWLLVIKRADAGPDAAGAPRLTEARAIADRAGEDLAASLRKAA